MDKNTFNYFLNHVPYNVTYTVTFNGENVTNLVYKDVEVENELARLDFHEEEIQQMTSFPEAEKLLNSIQGDKP